VFTIVWDKFECHLGSDRASAQRPRVCVLGIQLHGGREPAFRVWKIEPVKFISATQKSVVRLVARKLPRRPPRTEVDVECRQDLMSDLVLYLEDIDQFTLVTLRPDRTVSSDIDQLSTDANTPAGRPDAAFNDMRDIESSTD
jgi:hypothetical protein